MNDLESFFADASQTVDERLRRIIGAAGFASGHLRDAIEWSLFGGGKRFRPSLIFAVGETLGVDREKLESTAAAVEMIHTYSLIHDDLPAMDDDDLRRGRQTCHKKFGDATAILAGDVLQALAFETLATDDGLPAEVRLRLTGGLAEAAKKMGIGQQLDLDGEGQDLPIGRIREIHAYKTGALITFSAVSGAIVGGASDAVAAGIAGYGENLGLLFQISDDILDVTQPTEMLGKTASKDVAAQKSTYPRLLGIDGSRAYLREIYGAAVAALDAVDRPAPRLVGIADFVLHRES